MTGASLAVGDTFFAPPSAMTRERMRRYVDAQATAVANDGRRRFGGPAIDDDDAYAAKQGLSSVIADGIVSTHRLPAMLVDRFGPAAVGTGRLRTGYLRPVYQDDILTLRLRILT